MSDEAIINEINEILVYLEDEGEYHLDKDCDTEWLLAVKEVLNLINRQQAEIERYEKESNEQFDKMKLLDDRTKQRYAELFEEAKEFVRTEAIKEFAERLRKEVANTWFGVCCTGETEEYKEGCLHGLVAKQKHCLCIINNLLAEMVGEQ